jgi:hypothetical protein
MQGWHAATGHGSTVVLSGRPAGRRLLTHYAIDLIASITVVLIFGWLFEASASNTRLQNAVITQNEVYIAISRFVPHSLMSSYFDTVRRMTINMPYSYQIATDFSGTIQHALLRVGELVVNIALAVPGTLLELYHQTNGIAASVVLAGFSVALVTVFGALFATRTSMWRLILGAAISPLAISVLFLALQGFMIAMLGTFHWFTTLAPYTVACPVLCTLYWIAFPAAERGATASLAHALLRVLERKP